MRIIGIDPGTRIAGYGVVDLSEQKSLKAIAAGAWKLDVQKELPPRLATLAIEFRRVVEVYKPSHMCLELSFLADNPRTALFLGHARGVILSEAHQLGLVISEISATSAKKIISGNGRAEKAAIAKIMSSMLGFNFDKLPFDATDALAIACADAMRNRDQVFANSVVPLSEKSQAKVNILNEWQKRKKKSNTRITNFASLLKAK
ncbi:crossover junction endodeoxyribonuclease RuvC [Fluviispira vulneris]|uniref:crossover junction endodeoxyribonuclease RuvC n=1 Tax=Fluviispira vulneris TaxID=2763012 RepID=UPI001647E3F0|nr:crossover junction endodeoxyribonuclease RuvC [Fluviispira vulneris]